MIQKSVGRWLCTKWVLVSLYGQCLLFLLLRGKHCRPFYFFMVVEIGYIFIF
jgi:hypothetical protein